jgi:SAM-dependent methyltransferase
MSAGAVPGEVTLDGSPVAVYRAMPANGEPERIHGAIPAGATVLELGAAVGRVAGPLARLGHAVTGVDDSPAMLEAMDPDVEGVLGDAGTLRLGRTFDVVLLISHMLNDPDPSRFLETAVAHLAPGGRLIGEVYPETMDWTAAVGRSSDLGPVTITVTRAALDGPVVDANVRYELDGRSWDQPFVARMRAADEIEALLRRFGLAVDRWLDEPGWFVASRA